MVVENFPDSSDLYSEIGAVTRSAKVCVVATEEQAVPFSQMLGLCQLSLQCTGSIK